MILLFLFFWQIGQQVFLHKECNKNKYAPIPRHLSMDSVSVIMMNYMTGFIFSQPNTNFKVWQEKSDLLRRLMAQSFPPNSCSISVNLCSTTWDYELMKETQCLVGPHTGQQPCPETGMVAVESCGLCLGGEWPKSCGNWKVGGRSQWQSGTPDPTLLSCSRFIHLCSLSYMPAK